MTRRSVGDWLDDILIWAERLETHLHSVSWNGFLANAMLQDAVSKCVEAIGEAAGRLDDLDRDFSERHFGLQLKQAYRSRNRLSHGYFRIDRAILWQTAKESVPRLVADARLAKATIGAGNKPTNHLDWRNVSLLGIDVGYSTKKRTTALASYVFGKPIDVPCVTFDAVQRREALNNGLCYNAIAIDGPLLPQGWMPSPRTCETLLSKGVLGQRCRAAASHHGGGVKLRKAAQTIAEERAWSSAPHAPVVEAFPNAFLGVMLPEKCFGARIARGTRSDVYYRFALDEGCIERLLNYLGWIDGQFMSDIRAWSSPITRKAHDVRAAIACVLTAGCVLAGESTPLGDQSGGFIHLPPRALWADWARDALTQAFASICEDA